MFRRYGHQHSLALGAVLTLALERHWLVFALLVFCAGVVTGRAWAAFSMWSGMLKEKLLHAKREKIQTKPQPVYTVPPARGPSNEIPWG